MDHRKAEGDYNRGMKYKDIAEKYGVSLNTVRAGSNDMAGIVKRVHTKKKVCIQKSRVHLQAIRTL